MTTYILVIFSLLVLALLIFVTRPRRAAAGVHMLGAVLTPSEKAFYETLREVVGDDAVLLAKVRAGDLASPASPGKGAFARREKAVLRGIRFDFLICHPDSLVIMAAFNLTPEGKKASDQIHHRRAERLCQDSGIAYYELTEATGYSPFTLRAKLYGIDSTVIDSLPQESGTAASEIVP